MLKNIRNDLLYLLGILSSIAKIRKYSENCDTPEALFQLNDQLNYNACLNLLANIGENANKLSDKLKELHSDIKWDKIIGLRNRIVHAYESISIFITFEIIKTKLTELEEKIYNIIDSEIDAGNLNKDEYLAAKNSSFYKHIDFTRFKV